MHKAFHIKYFAHAQTVSTRPLLGEEGSGDEASSNVMLNLGIYGQI